MSTGQERTQKWALIPKDFDEHMTWRMRWFLVIAITVAYTLSLIGGLIAFMVTKDPRCLLFIAPTALIPFVRYLVPMDRRKYDLELAKINANKELSEARVRIQMLEAELSKQQGQLPTK
jgi:hypothetical protein